MPLEFLKNLNCVMQSSNPKTFTKMHILGGSVHKDEHISEITLKTHLIRGNCSQKNVYIIQS